MVSLCGSEQLLLNLPPVLVALVRAERWDRNVNK